MAKQSDNVSLFDFYKKDCGPCKLMDPIVNSISAEMPVLVAKIDVDENPKLAAQYQVSAFPTFVILKGGQIRQVIAGRVPAAKLREALTAVLESK